MVVARNRWIDDICNASESRPHISSRLRHQWNAARSVAAIRDYPPSFGSQSYGSLILPFANQATCLATDEWSLWFSFTDKCNSFVPSWHVILTNKTSYEWLTV